MKAAAAFFFLLVFCTGNFAQEKQVKHNYALSFGIADNFRLNRFDMDIAGKKILDNNNQIRIFLSPRFSSNDRETEQLSLSNRNKIESSNYSIGAGIDYLFYLASSGDFYLFSGPGMNLNYGYMKENLETSNTTGISITERNTPSFGAGLRGILGIEWMVSENIGIHSEYLLTMSYQKIKTEGHETLNGIGTGSDLNIKENRFSIQSRVLFGLSIYL